MPADERARRSVLAFQCPVEIPGVNNTYLRAAVNAGRRHRASPGSPAASFTASSAAS
jgi:Fe-S cluster assembly ATP-binding protein